MPYTGVQLGGVHLDSSLSLDAGFGSGQECLCIAKTSAPASPAPGEV